ncbi:MAG: VOC family protein [Flavobacteriaceae bacterium]
MRGIDHLVLAVHGMDHARDVYARMGFTLTPVNRHPFGTYNSLIQLQGNFLELLGVEDPDDMPLGKPGHFSFPRFNFLYLERHEGISMLVAESKDARADAKTFAREGIQAYLPFQFSRKAGLPDGSHARVGFRLAFASEPLAPEAGFFVCEQLAPEHFWKSEFQKHANTAVAVDDVVMVARAPVDLHRFMQVFTGNRDIRSSSIGIEVPTPRGTIRILTPRAAKSLWGGAIDVDDFERPRFAAYTVAVESLAAVRKALKKGEIDHADGKDRIVVPASQGFGAAIAFRKAGG